MRWRASTWVVGLLLSTASLAEAPGLGDAVRPGWWEQVRGEIETSEYEVSWQTEPVLADLDEAWHAPNRAQGFRTYFTERGIRVVDRLEAVPTWELSLQLVRFGRGELGSPVGAATGIAPDGNRVDYSREGVHEWYVNDTRGLEQGFDLAEPPRVADDEGTVFLELELGGSFRPVLGAQGQSIDFRGQDERPRLRYAALSVVDAGGHELPAWFELYSTPEGAGGVRLRFDDADAVWPIAIDPILGTALWSQEGDQALANLGTSVATAGDVNGDGFSDIVVGAPFYDNGQPEEGRAYVFHGSASGPGHSPAWQVESDFPGSFFGFSAASAGDVNGDGFSDVVVGAPKHYGSQFLEGRIWVYHGSPTGLPLASNWTVDVDQEGAQLGHAVASAGDVNGDGFSDVIASAPFYDQGQPDEGRVFIYYGSASGLFTDPTWLVESNQSNSAFGWSVSAAGDVNGDGFDDVIVGAPFYTQTLTSQGAAFVYYGGLPKPSLVPDFTATINQANAFVGWSVSNAGDVNGDAYADVVVGVRQYTNGQTNEGAAFLYTGSTSGLSSPAAWQVQSNSAGANMGWSVATAGDVNGDGYSDVIVGAPLFDNGEPDEGRVYLYEGAASGISTTATWVNESNADLAQYGKAVATAGDIDGDGFSDVLVGAPAYSGVHNEAGALWIHRGAVRGPDTAAGWTVSGSSHAGAELGFSVASAGDVDGDLFTDVIVGAPYWDNGLTDEGAAFVFRGSATGPATVSIWTVEGNQAGAHLGWSVASAGDTNGDGFDDVIVGAPELSNGQSQEGSAFAWLGTPFGPSTDTIWTAESNQAGARFGHAVASIGDVDGDGMAEIAIGAPQFDNPESNEGAVFVYRGDINGPISNAVWMQDGDQASATYGHDVAGAGDIHGDGHAELIIGAPLYDGATADDGRAYVYRGTALGLITQPFWTGTPSASGSRFGWSVDSAGDVNGDGRSDVVVGAPYHSNGQTQEGAAWLYASTGTSLSAVPAWNVESDQALAWLGHSVAGAGDLNGDGYTDVLVGAPQLGNGQSAEGRATAYLGSGTGLSLAPVWTAESNQATAQFGWEVASGGDVNGDGYSDIIIGAPLQDAGATDEGRISLYYGNGRGLDVTPGQRRHGDEAPISQLGVSDVTTDFRLRAVGKTPYGDANVGLEWEVRPQGTPLSGVATGSTTSWNPSGPIPFAFSPVVGGLTPSEKYHWQVRVLYKPSDVPWQQRSRWFRPPDNGRQELDVRMPAEVDLVVTQTESKDPVFVNETYTYTLNILAQGFHVAEVTLQDVLPPAVNVVSVTPSQGECLVADHVLTCFLGDFLPLTTGSVEVEVVPVSAGLQTNLARVGTPVTELFPPNNEEIATTTVNVPSLGNRVWNDLDGDGQQGGGEPGVANVLVALYDGSGSLLDVEVTAPNGGYSFSPLVFGNDYFVRFFPPPGFVLTLANQGSDLADSDPDELSLQTPVVELVEQEDIVRWDAGLIPYCAPPDEAIFIASMDVTDDGNRFPILNFQDPNQPSQVTGYNVYRSDNPELPAEDWPLVASDVVDMDESTANEQWVDSTGEEPGIFGIWYYLVTAYNHRCPAEGP